MRKTCFVVFTALAALPGRSVAQGVPATVPARVDSAKERPTTPTPPTTPPPTTPPPASAPAKAVAATVPTAAAVTAPAQTAPAKPAPAPVDTAEAKQIAADMASAAQLQRDKKFEQARAAYQAIVAAHPKGTAASAARWGVAQSYQAEGKIALAAPFLEMILADKAETPPALADKARNMLAEARLSIAAGFAKLKKYDAGIAILQQTVDDKQSSNAAVRTALREIADDYLANKKTAEAVATYRLLLTKPSVGDDERLDDIVALTSLAPASVDEFGIFLKAHPGIAISNLARAHAECGWVYMRLKQYEKAAAEFDAVPNKPGTPFTWTRSSMLGKARLAFRQKDKPAAIAILRDLLHRPVVATLHGSAYPPWLRLQDINQLVAWAPGTDVTEEVAEHFNHLPTPYALDLSNAAPKNDVLYPMHTADHLDMVINSYAEYLWQTKGRAPQAELQAVAKQLSKGGDYRPYVTSEFSKQVAKRIVAGAPLADSLKPLLSGDYQAAARAAWRRGRLARTPEIRNTWVELAALAVACEDQYRGGRAAALLKWAYPDAPVSAADKAVVPDPLAEYLDASPLPYQPSDAAMKAAAAELNGLRSFWSIDQHRTISHVLPDNDVLRLAMFPAEALDDYRIYLWRTTGRATAAQLGVVRNQLASGGEERPFVVSEQSKKLATMISPKAPLADYLKLLLDGDYPGAAKLAWKNARAAKAGYQYGDWVRAVALAIRCNDQRLNGRDVDFVKWTSGQLKGPDGKPVKTNPVAAFLGQ